MSNIHFNITLPQSSDGYARRRCAVRLCSREFHIQTKDAPAMIHCPYCGAAGSIQATHSAKDRAYAEAVQKEKATKYAHDEITKMLKSVAGSSGGAFKFTGTSQPYREKHVSPHPVTEKVDTPLTCPECQFAFKVYGIFGYCPKCRCENVRIYDENLAIIKAEIAAATNPQRALRTAYSELVSTMEEFFKRKTASAKHPQNWFQRLTNIDAFAHDKTGKHLGDMVTSEELVAIERVFGKRHLIIHNAAKADEKYLAQFPGDTTKAGDPVKLSLEEFDLAATATRKIIGTVFVPAGSRPFGRSV